MYASLVDGSDHVNSTFGILRELVVKNSLAAFDGILATYCFSLQPSKLFGYENG